MTESEAYDSARQALLCLRQVTFPTKVLPILPQQEPGIIRFKRDPPPPVYSLGETKTLEPPCTYMEVTEGEDIETPEQERPRHSLRE